MSIFQNTCKPQGLGGKFMISSMNIGHSALHKWGFSHIKIKEDAVCLDIGCGGGTNLKRLLDVSDKTTVYGIDYSDLCVEKSIKKCKKEIIAKRCQVNYMNVLDLKFEKDMFDVVTAFETIYFWKDLNVAFANVYKCMKEGGEFLICNESNGRDPNQEKWCKIIEGMKIYKVDEIKEALEKAGFKDIEIDDSYKSWACFKAKK